MSASGGGHETRKALMTCPKVWPATDSCHPSFGAVILSQAQEGMCFLYLYEERLMKEGILRRSASHLEVFPVTQATQPVEPGPASCPLSR